MMRGGQSFSYFWKRILHLDFFSLFKRSPTTDPLFCFRLADCPSLIVVVVCKHKLARNNVNDNLAWQSTNINYYNKQKEKRWEKDLENRIPQNWQSMSKLGSFLVLMTKGELLPCVPRKAVFKEEHRVSARTPLKDPQFIFYCYIDFLSLLFKNVTCTKVNTAK